MRTTGEILTSPQIGDTILGRLLGYHGSSKYCRFVRATCPSCGTPRWVRDIAREINRPHCRICALRYGTHPIQLYSPEHTRKYHPNAEGAYRTIRATDSPKEGDLIRGGEIGRNDLSLFKWACCPSCGKCRWIFRGTRGNPKCPSCGIKYKSGQYTGERSNRWKGGRIVAPYGYIRVRIYPDNPYYCMVDQIGYIPEHRLVMAMYIGRPLKRYEVVHHKNGIKNDNRIENLELIESRNAHNGITAIQREVNYLRAELDETKARVAYLEWRIKQPQPVQRLLEE